jgi:hypothetical protein
MKRKQNFTDSIRAEIQRIANLLGLECGEYIEKSDAYKMPISGLWAMYRPLDKVFLLCKTRMPNGDILAYTFLLFRTREELLEARCMLESI